MGCLNSHDAILTINQEAFQLNPLDNVQPEFMTKAKDYSGLLEIISGQKRGLKAMFIRSGLSLLTPFYRIVIGWRNHQFNRGKGVSHVGAPVISVGNLTTGGTGKTPFVIWLASFIRALKTDNPHGRRVAIISRGYGSPSGGVNDEAMEMEQRLPAVPHLQGADRVQLAAVAIEELETELLLLDDGFQHRKIARDLDIVLIDATEPFGYDRLLPRGLLREPTGNIRRADAIVLTRCNQVKEQRRKEIRNLILGWHPSAIWAEASMQPATFIQANGDSLNLAELREQAIITVCAIGNPAVFHSTINQLGLKIIASLEFPDHHLFSRDDLARIESLTEQHPARAIVCTHKDLVKLNVDRIGNCPLFALKIDTVLTSGREALEDRIKQLVMRQRN